MSEHHSGDGFDITVWDQDDNPGSGPTDFNAASPGGLNGNWIKFWRAVKAALNPDGTVKDDAILGRNVNINLADGTTLEFSASSGVKVLRVKDGGLTTSKYAGLSITTPKVALKAITDVLLANDAAVDANRAVGSDHVKDNAIILRHMADDSADAAVITHDNTARKTYLTFTLKGSTNGTWAFFHDVQLNANLGVPMPRAGKVIRFYLKENSATAAGGPLGYDYGSGMAFAEGDYLGVHIGIANTIYVTKNGAETFLSWDGGIGTLNAFVTLEVEFDD